MEKCSGFGDCGCEVCFPEEEEWTYHVEKVTGGLCIGSCDKEKTAKEAHDEDLRTILDIAGGYTRFKTDEARIEAILVFANKALARNTTIQS